MRYDFSLDRTGLAALLAGLGMAGVLLFLAGLLMGAAASEREPGLTMAVDTAAADTLAASDTASIVPAAATACPPAAGASPAPAGDGGAPSSAPDAAAAANAADEGQPVVATFRDERRAMAMLERMGSRGEEAVIEARAADDGGAVFRVVAAPGRRGGTP